MHPILIRNYLSRAFNGPLNDKIKTDFLFVSVVVVVRFSIDLFYVVVVATIQQFVLNWRTRAIVVPRYQVVSFIGSGIRLALSTFCLQIMVKGPIEKEREATVQFVNVCKQEQPLPIIYLPLEEYRKLR